MTSEQTVGSFRFWTTPTSDPNYLDCLFEEVGERYPYYINLHKDARFPVEFKFPPKPIKVKKKGDVEEEVPETDEEKIYRIEYSAYEARKDMQMPMWVLHKTTLDKVVGAMKSIPSPNGGNPPS